MPAFTGAHAADARVQTFGGYKSCRWDDADLNGTELAILAAALEAALTQLRARR